MKVPCAYLFGAQACREPVGEDLGKLGCGNALLTFL